jgi:hypothetical protein
LPKAPATICRPFTVVPICSDLSVDLDVAGAHAGLDGVADLLREDVGEEGGVAGDADLTNSGPATWARSGNALPSAIVSAP